MGTMGTARSAGTVSVPEMLDGAVRVQAVTAQPCDERAGRGDYRLAAKLNFQQGRLSGCRVPHQNKRHLGRAG